MKATMRIVEKNSGVFLIKNYLRTALCQHYIRLSEETGYVASEVNFADGSRRAADVRNNDRVIFDDPALAATLFERARPMLPEFIGNGRLAGFNERLRYYRYGPGEFFKRHRDGILAKSPDEASVLTFMIYLNADFEGGETEFKAEFIKPQEGAALVFPHKLPHQGEEVTSAVEDGAGNAMPSFATVKLRQRARALGFVINVCQRVQGFVDSSELQNEVENRFLG